jgi:hypothetical protein
MHAFRRLCIVAMIGAAILTSASTVMAAKKYQVTGIVVEVGDKVVVVEKKDGEKWEIDRTPDTKIDGELKKGAKVTIFYTMSASEIEVKG